MLEEIEEALNDENVDAQARRESRIVMVAEKGTPAPDGKVRYAVVWRSLESQWNTNEIYFLGDPVSNDGHE